MAQRTIDDIDGITPGETHTFTVDGYIFAVDLGPENWDVLAGALAPYVKAGRVIKGRPPHPALAQVTEEGEAVAPKIDTRVGPRDKATVQIMATVAADNKTVRDWWLANEGKAKYNLPEYKAKGIIPATVRDAFDKAHKPT